MKSLVINATVAAILAQTASVAQQSPNPSTPVVPLSDHSPVSSVSPCNTQVTPTVPKGWHFAIPSKLQQAIDKQRQQIESKAGVSSPSPEQLKKQAEQPKPCPAVQPATQPATQPKTQQ